MDIKEKISQMFILGFSGKELSEKNQNIQILVKNGLGGIIYFAENIESYEQIKNLSQELQNIAKIPLFISIDQEGGKVERTGNIKNKINYLTPSELAKKQDVDFIRQQTQIMSEELISMGVNMNFAPVLDVNTNPDNPVIGVRSFGNNPDDVMKYSEPVYKTLAKNNIIPVGKHFPGHGDTSVDSHIDMPVVDLNFEELEQLHIKPFISAINNGLDALMIAHVFYKAFNNESTCPSGIFTPASLSKKIITDYLKNKLNFKGLIISDDMIMGGVSKHYSALESCIRGINAGIDLFIYRNSTDEIVNLINNLALSVNDGLISEEKINESVEKILYFKQKYKIL
jgi:beta-N-acetylhexosaminidase